MSRRRPAVWLLFGLILTFVLNEFCPGVRFTSLEGQVVGGIVILIGLVLLVTANGLFTRAGTDVIPFRDVTALVTSGVYRYSRNPMYLGMAAVLLGCAITVGAATAFLPVRFETVAACIAALDTGYPHLFRMDVVGEDRLAPRTKLGWIKNGRASVTATGSDGTGGEVLDPGETGTDAGGEAGAGGGEVSGCVVVSFASIQHRSTSNTAIQQRGPQLSPCPTPLIELKP